MQNPETPIAKEKHSPITLIVGVLVLLAIGASIWTILKSPQSPSPTELKETIALKMGTAEQNYANSVHIENIALSRAENFIHQEVTILTTDVVNAGPLPVAALSLTVEFSDEMNQVVLRETRGVLGNPPITLRAGEKRSCEISFDHIPNSWNMQQPSVRVAYLRLPTGK
jgi:hypothetical protein